MKHRRALLLSIILTLMFSAGAVALSERFSDSGSSDPTTTSAVQEPTAVATMTEAGDGNAEPETVTTSRSDDAHEEDKAQELTRDRTSDHEDDDEEDSTQEPAHDQTFDHEDDDDDDD